MMNINDFKIICTLSLLVLLSTLTLSAHGNMAFKRDIIQSSTEGEMVAGWAVDGDESTYASTKAGGKREWIQIDLGGVVPVSVIEILPKPGTKLQNFWLTGTTRFSDREDVSYVLAQASFALFDPTYTNLDESEPTMLGKLTADQDVTGFPSRKGTPWLRYFVSFNARYLRIQANGTEVLQIAEIKVYPTTCGISYRRVGQVARISNRFHGVGGTAAVVDDCTIILSKFSFDADLSLETRIVVGPEGLFNTGVSISTNLVKAGPYNGDLLVLKDLRLPELLNRMGNNDKGSSSEGEEPQETSGTVSSASQIDALQCISVFCTQAWIDFGSGCFQTPPPDWKWN